MHKLLSTHTLPHHALALLSAEATRSRQQWLARQLPPNTLIERAGLCVARWLLAMAPHAQSVDVLAGRGHNGADALVAARWLHQLGRRVRVYAPAGNPASTDTSTPAQLMRATQSAGIAVFMDEISWLRQQASGGTADVLLDGLLGIGISRAPTGAVQQAIEWINAQSTPCLAIDIPSGLHPNTGHSPGAAVRAVATLSLLGVRPGLLTGQGRALCGEIWWSDLQPPSAAIHPQDAYTPEACAVLSGDADWRAWQHLHARRADEHKGTRGAVLVVGGGTGMHGALWLASASALASGAGKVWACSLASDTQAPLRPEIMRWATSINPNDADFAGKVVVAGCGAGTAWLDAPNPSTHDLTLERLLTQTERLVLDADGLNTVAARPAWAELLRQRAAQGKSTVITPHPLEAARLLGTSSSAVQADRLAAAKALCSQLNCTVVLKGSGSIIASPARLPYINASGNAALATPGSGDVLAGWLGGLWAQTPHESCDVHRLCMVAAHWHGRAALGHAGPLRAQDLVEAMAALHQAPARL
ncbi:NAD(P)H-hydrate dehydratase [Roseateles sp. BYS180W]|uniref:Bifunctional NAD(P)H-hydrate repair enzyme n=1 Tax=Roseateles rivi TaxID=3299028 RepID=A0ABW7FVT4_9BURK